MSAKPAKKSAKKNPPAAAPDKLSPVPASSAASRMTATPVGEPAPVGGSMAGAATVDATAWIDSADPRKRTIGKVVLIGVWIYVAALWLLALDQTFHWGIFGPKVPPLP